MMRTISISIEKRQIFYIESTQHRLVTILLAVLEVSAAAAVHFFLLSAVLRLLFSPSEAGIDLLDAGRR